jgi:Acetylglutamate kinase
LLGKTNNINKNTINDKLKEGFIPVIAPLGMDKEKNIYNINADTAAGFIASELKANKLLLLTDVPGILDEKKQLISSLSLKEANKILDEDFVSGGMKPKILTCIEAMNKGVKKSTILDGRIPHSLILELFTEHGIGTQIYS